MSRRQREVAASLDAPPELLPNLPELLHRLESLGSPTQRIVNLIAPHVARRSRVLDLACGKGALSIAVAAQTGCRVTGLDAFEPFIAHARRRADAEGVARRCEFVVGDVHNPKEAVRGPFDACMMIGLWSIDRAAPLLRSLTRPGGVYVLDDAVRLETILAPRHEHLRRVPTSAECRDTIESLGDRVLARVLMPRAQVQSMSRRIGTALARSARELARTRPDLALELRGMVARQREAANVLVSPLRPSLWLVRRGGPPSGR